MTRPDLAFLMEAHDGVSARIVQGAGFGGACSRACWRTATRSASSTTAAGRVNVSDLADLVDASGL